MTFDCSPNLAAHSAYEIDVQDHSELVVYTLFLMKSQRTALTWKLPGVSLNILIGVVNQSAWFLLAGCLLARIFGIVQLDTEQQFSYKYNWSVVRSEGSMSKFEWSFGSNFTIGNFSLEASKWPNDPEKARGQTVLPLIFARWRKGNSIAQVIQTKQWRGHCSAPTSNLMALPKNLNTKKNTRYVKIWI